MTNDKDAWSQQPAGASSSAAVPPPMYAGVAGAPPVYATNPYPKNWMGVVAMIAPFAGWVIPFGTIAGIVFGHLALGAVRRGEANNGGLARAGLILSYVFTALALLAIAAYIVFLVWAVSECADNPTSGFCSSVSPD